jgi:DNA-directed RNA polymerase beta subunit
VHLGSTIVFVGPVHIDIQIIHGNSTEYWPKPCHGTVVGVVHRKDGKVGLKIERRCSAASGDKFTTCHGHKGVVTSNITTMTVWY